MSVREIYLDPITRIEGHLGVHVKIDVNAKSITESHTMATMFRGWEIILRNRDPPDAPFITQRICGVCPVPHAYASVIALDMTLKVSPPPLAVVLRNLTDAAEILYDHPIQLFQLAGPDFSALEVSKFNPTLYNNAAAYNCQYNHIHGYRTVKDIMDAMNPFTGELYLYTLKMERHARKMASLLGAKHPHVNTFIPGGVSRTFNAKEAEQLASMVIALAGFAKLIYAVWLDLIDFLRQEGYENHGVRPANLLAFGAIEDPEAYDGTYENMSDWSSKRLIRPGVIINGQLVESDLKKIHLGVREYVKHSFYDEWGEAEFTEDPEGNPLDPNHPWNKETKPKPVQTYFASKYTWATTPRWVQNGNIYVMEVGPLARMWTTSLQTITIDDPFTSIRSGGGTITVELPETRSELLPESLWEPVQFSWSAPGVSNMLERYLARAFCEVYYAATALHDMYLMIDLLNKGKADVWYKFKRPALSFGAGLNEAGRGALGHWVIVKNGKIYRYQVITPTNWNVSPRDINENPGPMETALVGTSITEEQPPDDWVGVDAVRVIRSFDPCLACTVHMYVGNRLVKRTVGVGRF